MDAQDGQLALAALNPQIVAQLHSLADSWKSAAAELAPAPAAEPAKSRRRSKRSKQKS
jgi:hypothetical protein